MLTQNKPDLIEQKAIAALQYLSKVGEYLKPNEPPNFDQLRPQLVAHLRRNHNPPDPKKINKNLKRELKHGWLMPYLFQSDQMIWGRWDYWLECQSVPKHLFEFIKLLPVWNLISGKPTEIKDSAIADQLLPKEPIPELTLEKNDKAEKMLLNCLDSIPTSGDFYGISSPTYLDYFLDWFFFSVGHPSQPKLPEEPSGCEGASMRLYQLFDCGILSLFPWDYMGYIYCESMGKRSQQGSGFFPTPIPVAMCMAGMIGFDVLKQNGKDHRITTVAEPSVGTGAMLLPVSNFSLCAIGQDVNLTCLRLALFQFYLYAPWYAIPIWWLLPWCDLLHGDTLANPPTLESAKQMSINARYHFPEFFRSGVIEF